jgi:hypothetical protein
MVSSASKSRTGGGSGGLKGLLKSTGRFCYSTVVTISKNSKDWMATGYTLIGHTAFGIATTTMIVLMPLLFEIARETQVRNTNKDHSIFFRYFMCFALILLRNLVESCIPCVKHICFN